MSLQVIYVTRHGFRSNWVVELGTGQYSSSIPSPTGIPADPALTGYGARQALELAERLVTLDPPIQEFYSSPFYRCIQTLNPALDKLSLLHPNQPEPKIYVDNGLGEWFGAAHFEHPSPAEPALLNKLFPRYELGYKPTIVPSTKGETIDDLHDRTAYALHRLIEKSDSRGTEAIIICTHAATVYAIGRALTGRMPEDVTEEDFRAFACGLSKFVRRSNHTTKQDENQTPVKLWEGVGSSIPKVDWRGGKGVGGGWDCEINGDCSFLSGGEERGWRFSGDESFIATPGESAALDAGSGLGIVVEGKKPKGSLSPKTLSEANLSPKNVSRL